MKFALRICAYLWTGVDKESDQRPQTGERLRKRWRQHVNRIGVAVRVELREILRCARNDGSITLHGILERKSVSDIESGVRESGVANERK